MNKIINKIKKILVLKLLNVFNYQSTDDTGLLKKCSIDYTKPNENRKFKIGDVVLYDCRCQTYGTDGNEHDWIEPYTRTGIMLIESFDFDADYACRCSVGRSAIGMKADTIYGNFCPCGKKYRLAKKHHIRKFIKAIEKYDKWHLYDKEVEYLKEKIM